MPANHLALFQNLGSGVSFYQPIATNFNENSHVSLTKDPDLIVMLTWFAASPRHIAKYTDSHRKVFPTSPILLITTTTWDVSTKPKFVERRRFTPVVDIITKVTKSKEAPNIIFHLFSNGDAFSHNGLTNELRAAGFEKHPGRMLIFDSTPGHGRYEPTLASILPAVLDSFPRTPVISVPLGSSTRALFWLLWTAQETFSGNLIEAAREEINNADFISKDVLRIYLYSVVDEMVPWEDVEEHSKEARELGWDVNMVKFQGSEHCAHIREDEQKYWSSITDVWSRL
jgi:Eukaryotic protein of unknown function (DUF829)